MDSGIYIIFNHVSNKLYIGQTRNLKNREYCHFHALKNGKHHNKYLQRAFNHDGEDAFHFIVVERCPVEELDEREKYYIKAFRSMDNLHGYNLESGGNVGKEVSEAVKEAKRGASNPMYGKHISGAHVEALRIKNRCHGSLLTEEDVEKIKLELLHGANCSELGRKFGTTRAVITKIKTGKNFYWVRPDLNDKITEDTKKRERNKKIRELAEAGYSRNKISKELGIMPSTVAMVLGRPSDIFVKNSPQKQALRRNILEDYRKGISREEIMKTYAINPSMYVSIISDEYNKNLKELQSKAIEMRKSGMMVKDIAKELGYARTTISRWTKSVK